MTVVSTLTTAPPAAAAACADVHVVFARGSGQEVGSSDQANRFFSQLRERVGAGIDLSYYELGASAQGGNQYEAVNVSDLSNGNATGAFLSGGQSNDYGDSVDEGVDELLSYVGTTSLRCWDTRYVFGGFSQGAQVIGEAYAAMDAGTREKVIFNALFGDPRLHLPEGEGFRPPACRGEELSPWRRRIADCHVDNGSLGAREPYLPPTNEWNTGLWCAAHDYVCGSTKNLTDTDGHRYFDAGGDIDAAVIEIVSGLKARYPDVPDEDLDDDIDVVGTGTTGLDVLFVIDSTGSMSEDIEGAKAYAASMASQIAALRGRVALVEYRDSEDEFVARTHIGLTQDIPAFEAKLATLEADGGGDEPEALLAALMEGFNSLDWRPGATKAAVVLTDAGFHNPDIATGVTVSDVVARSLEIDPVNVYPVVPDHQVERYAELADRTSGQVVINGDDSQAALTEALKKIERRPVAMLALGAYEAQPGQSIRFDASDSYATAGTLVSYQWDVDGDGTFEATTTEPVHQHVYAEPFMGQMAVRITDSEGGIASMSVPVTVAENLPNPAAGLTKAPLGLTVVPGPVDANRLRSAELSWAPPADGVSPASYLLSMNGVGIGITERTSVTVTDLRAGEDVVLSVAGMTADKSVGAAAEVKVARVAGLPDPKTSLPPTATPGASPGGGATPAAPTLKVRAMAKNKTSKVRWSSPAAGDQVQVQSRRAQYNRGFSSWRDLRATAGVTKAVAKRLKPGHTVCYRARTITSTTQSGWSTPQCSARPLDDRSLASSGWLQGTGKGWYGRTFTSSRSSISTLTLANVRKSTLGLLVQRCKSCGKVEVRVAGRVVDTVNTRRARGRAKHALIMLQSSKPLRGTLTLRAVSRRPVKIDGVMLRRYSN